MSDPVIEAQRRLAAWRSEHAPIASAVRMRIDRMYAGRRIAEAVDQVVADEVAERAEGKRTHREQTRWAEVTAHAHDPARTREVFGAIVDLYLEDIAGGFDRRLYGAVMAVLPRALDRLVRSRFAITGPIDRLQTLVVDHTLVFAPTHSSNLDSLVVGVALRRSGLPACAYAAGKHMYRNPVLARLMAKLGAYRVDRGLVATLYKDVLKAYAAELLDRGFHSVIFPGATRCRTNEIESQLKLGLLGTSHGARRPIAIVPVTLSYQVVLEAPGLIRHFLSGKSAERIGGDSPSAGGLLAAVRRVLALDEVVVVAFGEPLDPASVPKLDAALTGAYRRDTVLFETHVVARALHELAVEQTGCSKIHELVRLGGCGFASTDVQARVTRVVELIQGQRGGGVLAPTIDPRDPDRMITTALRAWAACHPEPVAVRRGHELTVEDVGVVYFYRNRTAHLGS
ncbi:MAG: 1-acyl-sn-glycerol-3-phosphate acyltransferase [Deltaproteobacteria bacterium]|nr:1-acyl-sn-glycerol-3-phosphate acyltransferase [Deltaproteobacteria bacterium]